MYVLLERNISQMNNITQIKTKIELIKVDHNYQRIFERKLLMA